LWTVTLLRLGNLGKAYAKLNSVSLVCAKKKEV
jgi:hypothetical protein